VSTLVPVRNVVRRASHGDPPHPRYVVWELTLACDQRCTHCGSRAAVARANELSTEEALGLVGQLASMGTREVALIGGEAYLHAGFLDIVAAIHRAGMRPSMTTGGRGITAELATAMAQAGLYAASVSIDGLRATHDLLRATRGGFDAALLALRHLRSAGIRIGSNTVVSSLNFDELERVYEILREEKIEGWQVQLVAPLGRAADRPEMLLQPWQLLELLPRLAKLKERARADGVLLMPGNNVGYYSVDEKRLRSVEVDAGAYWQGCNAGRYALGVEADGAVKGCPSLQTASYVGGNVRAQSLREIWDRAPELAVTRARTVDDLWGYCRSCDFAATCMAGCTFTAHGLFGRAGNNPYCHYRAKQFADRGLRERLAPAQRAPGRPFDNGRFEIVIEAFDAPLAKPRGAAALKVWRG
jgi:radical SAM protein with 4Fe4S-binding SPASM domain